MEVQAAEDSCRTPRHDWCKAAACPAPPRKKRGDYLKPKTLPPKDGYFRPPELELFFAGALRRRQGADAT
ncbi:hypothetical protein ACS0TY_000888 [Phlomoides rotata]